MPLPDSSYLDWCEDFQRNPSTGRWEIWNFVEGRSRRLPHLHCPHPPLPHPQPKEHPTAWKRNKKLQVVWPRDKKQKGARTWDRLGDLFTGKGPDMWISRQYSKEPHRPVWSGWETKGEYCPPDTPRWNNLGYLYREKNSVLPPSWAQRGEEERYDFKSRKYRRPRAGVWSDVKWSNQEPHIPLYRRDQFGVQFVEPDFDDGYFNAGLAENPFANNRRSPYWDWNSGDRQGW